MTLRALDPAALHAPTHVLSYRIAAFRILATDEIGPHRRLTVIADGEPAHVTVPADFCRAGVPVAGDWLLIWEDGAVTHRRDDAFRAEARPVPRANAGCLSDPPRVPRFSG